MIYLKDKQFNVLLNFFYSQFFCEGLENAINDEEVSVVTTFAIRPQITIEAPPLKSVAFTFLPTK